MGKLFIISGPSGAGKTKVTEGAIALGVGTRVITCTTRTPRANNGVMEIPDVDYHFFTKKAFAQKIAEQAFAEFAEVYGGKHYGTLKSDIEETMANSSIALIVVDVQGAETLMRLYPDAVSVFIAVPREDMESRLLLRGDLPKAITDRLAAFDTEMAKAVQFHFVISNANNCLNETVDALIALAKR